MTLTYAANLIGIIGVPVFLIASGYFFRKQRIKDFITSKFTNIVVPWLIWGTVVYFVSLIAGGDIKYIPYLLGFGTWLYYVPLYLFITFCFNYLNSHSFLLLSILVSFSSISLTYFFCEDIGPISPYQNPLNWIGFYAIGVLLKSKSFDNWAMISFGKISAVIGVIGLLVYLMIHFKTDICYWNPLCFIFEILCFVILSNVCSRINKTICIESLGKFSYLIYFLHMQFGIYTINSLCAIVPISETWIFFIKPVLVVLVTYVYVKILIYIVKFLGIQKFNRYLGIPIAEK